MKTLHLPSTYLPWAIGGSEIYCHRLCQNIQSLGVEVRVAIHQGIKSQEPLGTQHYEGVPVQVLPSIPDAYERVALYTRATSHAPDFQQLLTDYQPDIVHFHNFSVSQGITHLRLAKAAGCKIVLTYHTPSNSCSQHGLLYRSKIACDGRISLQRCSECRLSGAGLYPLLASVVSYGSFPLLNPASDNTLIRLLTTRNMTVAFRNAWLEMIELVDALHVLAEWTSHIAQFNGAPAHKVRLIRTGGPSFTPHRSRQSMEDGILRLVFAGRSTVIKGIHILVAAIQCLPQDLPVKVTLFRADLEWEEKQYGHDLQARIEADERFEVKYNVSNEQLIEQLANYDACIVPSLWLETGPLIVLEAFAAGIPVVGSRLGGIAELVRDRLDGLLFEPGDSQELVKIIKNFIQNPDYLQFLKKNVQPPRTMGNVAQETLLLYQELKP